MHTRIFVFAVVLAAGLHPARAAALTGVVQDQRDEQTERVTRKFRLGQDGRVIVSNLSGDIVVTGGGGDEVSIEAVKRTRGDRSELANVNIDIDERPGRITVQTAYPNRRVRGRNGVSVHFTISVPAATDLDLRSLSGTLRITGVRGVVRAESMSGDVVTVKTPRVQLAQTVSGAIDLSDADLDGDFEASSMSGNIRARGLKARRVQLSTVSGDVAVADVSSSRLDMKSMSGNLQFGGPLAPNGRYAFSSHSGNVRLAISNAVGFELNATSFSGDVSSDIPVTLGGRSSDSPSRRGRGPSRRSITAVFGDGSATLDVTSFSGNISVTRR